MDLLRIIIAGACGGFGSWLWAISGVGTKMALSPPLAIVVCVFLGALAAVVGVLVANTDQKDLVRATAFAVLCGFCWRPVIDAAQAFMTQRELTHHAEDLMTQTQQLAATLSTTPSAQLPARIEQTSQLTAELLRTAAVVNDSQVKRRAQEIAATTVKQISTVGTRSPQVTTAAFERIGVAAVDAGQHDLALQTVGSLSNLGEHTPVATSRTLPEVHDALQSIAQTARVSNAPDVAATANARAIKIDAINGSTLRFERKIH